MLKNIPLTRVIEIFYSLSGEGITAGIPTVFLRLAGCSLRCGKSGKKKLWCDTPYGLSYSRGHEMSLEAVMHEIKAYMAQNKLQIIITGGEPLEKEKKVFTQAVANEIHKYNYGSDFASVRIETNGKENISGLKHMVFSIDYKLPGSGMEKYMNPENFRLIAKRKNPLDEIKFVVRDNLDFNHSLSIINAFHLENCNLIYSPVHGELSANELADWLKEIRMPKARLSLPLHKFLWGNKKGV